MDRRRHFALYGVLGALAAFAGKRSRFAWYWTIVFALIVGATMSCTSGRFPIGHPTLWIFDGRSRNRLCVRACSAYGHEEESTRMSMGTSYRTHMAGLLRAADTGAEVRLVGWVIADATWVG